MGQEERKNKAKLEKTQVQVAQSNHEYELAIKILEETTVRWNRDWKAAADKFQDLEEERLDFTKTSLWTFANLASTVCVSDDASCEKIRISLESCEVEKDIMSFIREQGTGQEIPDPPKYINFCRGDASDTQSEASEDDHYSVAQFQRTINPAFRTSSPQPSTYESHHDPKSELARELGHREPETPSPLDVTPVAPKAAAAPLSRQPQEYRQDQNRLQYEQSQHGPLATVPHDPYPMDGMTMLCRTGPSSEKSSAHRPSSREDTRSEYSNPTSFSSMDPPSGKQSPLKQDIVPAAIPEKAVQKRKSGFFSNSPFRRKSKHEKDVQNATITPSSRNTWVASKSNSSYNNTPTRSQPNYGASRGSLTDRQALSPEPVDPRANFQLNIGNNVFDVARPDKNGKVAKEKESEDLDPIAQALAELKGVAGTKQSSSRVSADRYSGLATPNPEVASSRTAQVAPIAPLRGTPPPSYDQPVSRLGLPKPAFTSKAMQQTSQQYQSQTKNMFSASQSRTDQSRSYGTSSPRPSTRGNDVPRAMSPLPSRSVSPRPGMESRQGHRSTSPNPSSYQHTQTRSFDQSNYRSTPSNDFARSVSPAPSRAGGRYSGADMALQLAPAPDDGYGSRRSGRPTTSQSNRPMSSYYGRTDERPSSQQAVAIPRQRSKSVADGRQFNREGRPILHFGNFCSHLFHFDIG